MSKWARRTQRALPIAILAVAIVGAPVLIFEPEAALDRVTDFACIVWEDGSAEDCVVADVTHHDITVDFGP